MVKNSYRMEHEIKQLKRKRQRRTMIGTFSKVFDTETERWPAIEVREPLNVAADLRNLIVDGQIRWDVARQLGFEIDEFTIDFQGRIRDLSDRHSRIRRDVEDLFARDPDRNWPVMAWADVDTLPWLHPFNNYLPITLEGPERYRRAEVWSSAPLIGTVANPAPVRRRSLVALDVLAMAAERCGIT